MNISPAIFQIILLPISRRHFCALLRITAGVALAVALSLYPLAASATIVRIETNLGGFNVELYDAQAPLTVANFLNYVNRSDYNMTVIHRSAVTGNPPMPFVIQGGGYRCCLFGTLYHFPTDPPVPNEFDPSRSNVRGTIAMAKSADPDSATSEWFFNLGDNSAALDNTNNSGGFTVFGHVLDSGMNVVDAIASLPITPIPGFPELPGINGHFVTVVQICTNTEDGDGACSATEDLAPAGDGNGDGIPDRDQDNVTTTLSIFNRVITFATGAGAKFEVASSLSPDLSQPLLARFSPPSNSTAQFNDGIYTIRMNGSMGSGRIATLYHASTTTPNRYYAYGPTPDNTTPHWYDFSFDGATGAEIVGDKILLHFVDGQRGDDDLTVNDSITHTGAPVLITDIPNTEKTSVGCSIAATPSQMRSNGDWIVVSMFLAFVALVRRRNRLDRIRGVPRASA